MFCNYYKHCWADDRPGEKVACQLLSSDSGFSLLDRALLSGHHLGLGSEALGKDHLLGGFLSSGGD